MRQQVNFYSDRFKPKKELLTLKNMLLAWFASIVVVLALYNFEAQNATFAQKSWQMVQKRQQHQQQQLQNLQNSFAARGDALIMEKILADKEASLQQRNYVLEQLGVRATGRSRSIAGLMENLATLPVPGLWLTEIIVDQGQLSLSGVTNNAQKVPQFIQKIQNMQSLQNKRFVRLEVKVVEDGDGLLMFTLQSENQVLGQVAPKGRSR